MKYGFEAVFRAFVRSFGGEIVSENELQSADFFFAKDDVVAELKTLQEDARREHAEKLTAALNDWARRGLLPRVYGTTRISLRDDLPQDCQPEWLKIFEAPIENIIKKANRQIRSTKQAKRCPEARGLLLIANDGNLLHTSPRDYMNFVARVLAKKAKDGAPRFPHIHGVVYFSYRIRSRDEGLPFWISGYTSRGGDPHMTAFQHRLLSGWFSYLSRITSPSNGL